VSTYGFDKASAEKIARVVRGALGAAGGEKSHRRADVSGPGNRVTLGELMEVEGNTHKFRFVAASYTETVGFQATTYQDVPGNYYAHDICADSLAVGDYVWIVDHNNQWFIIEKCVQTIGGAGGDDLSGCCGGCGNGSITTCTSSSKNCMPSYYFMIPDFLGDIEGDEGCCDQLAGPHIVYHDVDCTWKGIDLDQCNQVGGAYPAWGLTINGESPWDVTLLLSLDTTGSGSADANIRYQNPYPYCCNCVNKFVLVCPDELPAGCDGFPCELCLLPGPKCCPGANLAQTLTATISNGGNCPCAHNVTVTLEYRPATQDWWGAADFCTSEIELTLSCTVDGGGCSDFRLDVKFIDACSSGGEFGADANTCDCNPFEVVFESISVDGCCGVASTGANITIVVTE